MKFGTALRRSLAVFFASIFALQVHASAQPSPVALTPSVVVSGSPELIRVAGPATATLHGEWLGQKIEFFRSGRAWLALAGVDVQAPIGPSQLQITETLAGGSVRDLSRTIDIHPAHYRTARLSVAPRFINPTPSELAAIEAEIALKKRIFTESAPRPLWSGNFRAPVKAMPTASFGVRRVFNGKLASVHNGMDFRARVGTSVHASNNGVVLLARKLYFEGNCVVLDHGLGLYTVVMHLSRIDVREGEHVAKGQLLGLSGATGRVTGPHLHWEVRWENAHLDPAKLLRMNLSAIRRKFPVQ